MSTSISNTPAANALAAMTSSNKSNSLGQEAFMNLLVTQLQHQDPTQPQDDGAFIAQLATFSSLEQLQNINTTLTTIANFFNSASSTATSASAKNTTDAATTIGN